MNPLMIGKISGGTGNIPVLVDQDGRLLTAPEITRPSTTLTRPANTTAISANKTVTNSAADFSLTAGRFLAGLVLTTNQTTCTARFRVHLFITQDNLTVTDGGDVALGTDLTGYLGSVDLPAMRLLYASAAVSMAVGLQVAVPCLPVGAGHLYMVLETLDGFTPASEQTFTIYPVLARL